MIDLGFLRTSDSLGLILGVKESVLIDFEAFGFGHRADPYVVLLATREVLQGRSPGFGTDDAQVDLECVRYPHAHFRIASY